MMGYIAFMLYLTWGVAFIVLLMLLYACAIEWKEDRDERKRQERLSKYNW